jgi:hypothetical protein
MAFRKPKKTIPWTEEHNQFCLENRIPPAARILWQWLLMQGEAEDIEPNLAEFNAWVAKHRGKPYGQQYVKTLFKVLVNNRVVEVVKEFSWKAYRCLLRPLEWLKPLKKQNLQNREEISKIAAETAENSDAGLDSSSNLDLIQANQETLKSEGIEFNENEVEVLDRPAVQIKAAIILFNLRGRIEKILNPEGWIRSCLRGEWWLSRRNMEILCRYFQQSGNTSAIYELYVSS